MAVEVRKQSAPQAPARRPTYRVSAVVLMVLAGIAALLGAVILLGGEDQYVGLGGDLTWRVGDIGSVWGYGLLVAAAACLTAALGLIRRSMDAGTAQGDPRADLLVHAVVFLVVNAFLWVQDIALGGGLDYAYWVTIPWGIGLLGHALATIRAGRASPAPPR